METDKEPFHWRWEDVSSDAAQSLLKAEAHIDFADVLTSDDIVLF